MPAVTRIGDAEVPHPFKPPHHRLEGSDDVLANGIGVSRVGDLNVLHLLHQSPIASGSPTIFADGIPVGRIGDPTCTSVAEGSPDVFADGD